MLLNKSFDQRDEFNRREIAENVIKLLNTDLNVSPLLIDSEWGSGKTEFCEKLVTLAALKKENPLFIYIDAHSYDHTDDPLLMVLTKLSQAFPANDVRKDIIKKAIPIVKFFSKTLGQASLSWILRQNAAEITAEMQEILKKSSGDAASGLAEYVFAQIEKQDEHLELLKKTLQEISKDQKIVFIIDELDRCRPSFALATLEKVKHIFQVPGVKFILSTNSTQLYAVIKKHYGQDLNAILYLEKFFKFKVKLPIRDAGTQKGRDNSYRIFKDKILAHEDLCNLADFSNDTYETFFDHLFRVHGISLRQAEVFFENLLIYDAISTEKIRTKNWVYSLVIMLGVFIYTFDDRLIDVIEKDALTIADLQKLFGKAPPSLTMRYFSDVNYVVEAIMTSLLVYSKLKSQTYTALTSEDRTVVTEAELYVGNGNQKINPFNAILKAAHVLQMKGI